MKKLYWQKIFLHKMNIKEPTDLELNHLRFKFFTIQFQLNLSGLSDADMKNAEYQYKIENVHQDVLMMTHFETDGKGKNQFAPIDEADGYRTIEKWKYNDTNNKRNIQFAQKQKPTMSTKPTFIQFITKIKDEDITDYEDAFEISFRIIQSKNTFIYFDPLVNDKKIIPNTSYVLISKNDEKVYKLFVILNSQESFNIPLYSAYKGFIIDDKDNTDSALMPWKYYEIFFKDQNCEYILYRSEIQDKKYRWFPFFFRYLNLSNPKLFTRFYYSDREPLTPVLAPSLSEYIDFSCQSNSYKEFLKSNTDEASIENRCKDTEKPHYFIFPLIKTSPLDLFKIKQLKKINSRSYYIFIQNNSNKNSYNIFSRLSNIFMTKIKFNNGDKSDYKIPENQELQYDINSINNSYSTYDDLKSIIDLLMENAPKYCNWQGRSRLINGNGETLIYQVLFVYDYEDESKPEHDYSKSFINIRNLLNFYFKKSTEEGQSTNISNKTSDDIFSISGKQIMNMDKSIKNYDVFEKLKKKEEKKNEEVKQKKIDLYSGFPLIIVTLFQTQNSNQAYKENDNAKDSTDKIKSKFDFWTKICLYYPFIKLICIKEKEKYENIIQLKYLSELKCIHNNFLEWTSQINFNFRIQMNITDKILLNPTLARISNSKEARNLFIRRKLLELVSFDFKEWIKDKGHFSVFNYFLWKDPQKIFALRDLIPKKDIIAEKLKDNPAFKKSRNSNKELNTYATIFAAATSVFCHNQGSDPYAEPCFVLALNWILNHGVVEDKSQLEDIILSLNQATNERKREATNDRSLTKTATLRISRKPA